MVCVQSKATAETGHGAEEVTGTHRLGEQEGTANAGIQRIPCGAVSCEMQDSLSACWNGSLDAVEAGPIRVDHGDLDALVLEDLGQGLCASVKVSGEDEWAGYFDGAAALD